MASDRLMATSWRFEVNKGNPNAKRFQQDALVAQREIEARELKKMSKDTLEGFKTQWNDKFTAINERSQMNNLNKTKVDDLNIVRKANVMVRRAALKDLYLREYNLYESELKLKGLSLHKERI